MSTTPKLSLAIATPKMGLSPMEVTKDIVAECLEDSVSSSDPVGEVSVADRQLEFVHGDTRK